MSMSDNVENESHLLEFEYRSDSTQDALDKIRAINQSNRSNRTNKTINQTDLSSLAPSISPNIDTVKAPPRKRPRQSSLPSMSSQSPPVQSSNQSIKRQSVRSHSSAYPNASNNQSINPRSRVLRTQDRQTRRSLLEAIAQPLKQPDNQSNDQSINQSNNHYDSQANNQIENTINSVVIQTVTRSLSKTNLLNAPVLSPPTVDPFSSAYINQCINPSNNQSNNQSTNHTVHSPTPTVNSTSRYFNHAQSTAIQHSSHITNQPVRISTSYSNNQSTNQITNTPIKQQTHPHPPVNPSIGSAYSSPNVAFIHQPVLQPLNQPNNQTNNQPLNHSNNQTNNQTSSQPVSTKTYHANVPIDLFDDIDFDEPVFVKQSWSNSSPVPNQSYQTIKQEFNQTVKHEFNQTIKQEVKQELQSAASIGWQSNQSSTRPGYNQPQSGLNGHAARPVTPTTFSTIASQSHPSITPSINQFVHPPQYAHASGLPATPIPGRSTPPAQQPARSVYQPPNQSLNQPINQPPSYPQPPRHSVGSTVSYPPPSNQSVNQTGHQTNIQSTNQSTSHSINQSITQPGNQSSNQSINQTYPVVKQEPQPNSQSRYYQDDDDEDLIFLSQHVSKIEEQRKPSNPAGSASGQVNQPVNHLTSRTNYQSTNQSNNQSSDQSYCSSASSASGSINHTSVYNVSIDPPGPIFIPFDQSTKCQPIPCIKSPARKTQSFSGQILSNQIINQSINQPISQLSSPSNSQAPFANAASLCFRGVLKLVSRSPIINQVLCVVAAENIDPSINQPTDHRLIRLLDDWIDMPIQAGMTVHVIGKFEPINQSLYQSTNQGLHQRSFSLPDPPTSQSINQSIIQLNIRLECVIDQSNNMLVVEPDYLISPSTIVESLRCVRRGLIIECGKSFGFHSAATRGSIAHEVTENMIESISQSKSRNLLYNFTDLFNQSIDQAIKRHLADLYACNDTEEACRAHLRSLAPSTESFLKMFDQQSMNSSALQSLNNQSDNGNKHDLHEIEEQIWSPLYGLKGKIDLSVSAPGLAKQAPKPGGWQTKKRLMPVELKTGYADVKHRAQVLLYTLLMAERYAVKIDQGILMYLSTNQSNNQSKYQPKNASAYELTVIPVIGSEVRSLIVRRNAIACYLSAQSLSQPNHQSTLLSLPPITQTVESECKRCFSRQTCTILQAASSSTTSSNDQMYPSLKPLIAHLKPEDMSYVRGWVSAVEAEWDECESERRLLWLQPVDQSVTKGTCIDGLTILDAKKFTNNQSTVRFKHHQSNNQSSNQTNISGLIVGDSVILSSEKRSYNQSTDPSASLSTPSQTINQTPSATPSLSTRHNHFGVACGTIVQLTQYDVVVQLRAIPLVIRPFLIDGQSNSQSTNQSVNQSTNHIKNQARRARAAARVFRLDREEIVSGHRTLIASIINLFTEPLEPVIKPSSHPNNQANNQSFNHMNNQSTNETNNPVPVLTEAELRIQRFNDMSHRYRRHLRNVLVGRTKPTFGPFISSTELHDQSVGLLTRLHIPLKVSINQSISDIPSPEYMRRFAQFRDLSLSQQECVQNCMKANQFALVHGYPGSGKSSTIACLIALLISCQQRVLIACSTHNAVDHLMEKVIQCEPSFDRSISNRNSTEHQKYARIGYRERVSPPLHFSVIDAEHYFTLSALEQRVDAARLVGCTLSSCSSPLLSRTLFDYCIIDEAALSTEPGCIVALQRANKFVLVGDPCQLPPVVKSLRARQQGLDKSLLHRLAQAYPCAVSKLNQQYRMNATICDIASKLSYDDTLTCADSDTANQVIEMRPMDQTISFLSALFIPGSSVVWLDTSSLSTFDADVDDVAVVSCLAAQALLASGSVGAHDCVVLSPYHAHLNLLTSLLPASVDTSTIDRYQGKEARCVVLSCGAGRRRSSKQETAAARMNVAITRAKAKLVIVGNEAELGKELVTLCETYRVRVDERQLMQLDQARDLIARARRVMERPMLAAGEGNAVRKLEW